MIDTSVLDRVINQKQKGLLLKLISKYRPVIPVNVLEELFFRIIVTTVGSEIESSKYFDIKEAWEKCAAKEEVKEKMEIIFELIDGGFLEVVGVEYSDIKVS